MNDICQERVRQIKKWGQQNHIPYKWMSILMEEVGEASKALLEYKRFEDLMKYRKELVEVAAVAIAAIDNLDRDIAKGVVDDTI